MHPNQHIIERIFDQDTDWGSEKITIQGKQYRYSIQDTPIWATADTHQTWLLSTKTHHLGNFLRKQEKPLNDIQKAVGKQSRVKDVSSVLMRVLLTKNPPLKEWWNWYPCSKTLSDPYKKIVYPIDTNLNLLLYFKIKDCAAFHLQLQSILPCRHGMSIQIPHSAHERIKILHEDA